eukprot:gene55489-76038_t
MLTAFRDLRDNFAAEIWQALGYGDAASVFTASEGPVAALSLVTMGVLIAVKNNGRALLLMHGVILAGFAILGGSTLAFQHGLLSPIAWMIAGGAGLYLAYTPFNAMLFDRMIACSGTVATAGFLIYVADASGYLGSVILLLVRNFAAVDLPWLPFFVGAAYATSLAGLVLVTGAAILFLRGRGDGSARKTTADPGEVPIRRRGSTPPSTAQTSPLHRRPVARAMPSVARGHDSNRGCSCAIALTPGPFSWAAPPR